MYTWKSYDCGHTWSANQNPAFDAEVIIKPTYGDFTVEFTFTPVQFRIFWNGLLLNPNGDYTRSGNTVSFTVQPSVDDALQIDFLLSGLNMNLLDICTFSTGSVWLMSATPATGSMVEVFYNGGVLKPNADYTISGNQITFLTITPKSTDFVAAAYTT